jgi:hypothetical protein
MVQTQRRTECEGKHALHDAIMEVYHNERHTNDVHSLFVRIDESYRGNHTPQTFYAEIRDAIEHLLCQGWIKPTPSPGYFVLSTCDYYDAPHRVWRGGRRRRK